MRAASWMRAASVAVAMLAAPTAGVAKPKIALADPPADEGASRSEADEGDAAPSVPSVTGEAAAASKPARFALGLEVGEPTSATVTWFSGKLAVVGALGTGTFAGLGIHLHADAQYEVRRLAANLPLRVGLGARYYHHDEPASVDEIPHGHYGLRASASVTLERGAVQLYAELAPGVDVKRTASCSLINGANSVCPHAMESPLFLEMVVGARWLWPR